MIAQIVVRAPFANRHIEVPEEGEARLIARTGDGYQWSNGWKTPVIFVNQNGWFWVDVMVGDSTLRDSIYCKMVAPCFYVRNTMTPNEETLEDCLNLHVTCEMDTFSFVIYNRWGNLMYKTENPKDCWDGKTEGKYVPDGVYTYILHWTETGSYPRKKTGTITIYR